MFKIVRTYANATVRDFLVNLTETQANNYMSRATVSGPTRGGIKGGSFTDTKAPM